MGEQLNAVKLLRHVEYDAYVSEYLVNYADMLSMKNDLGVFNGDE